MMTTQYTTYKTVNSRGVGVLASMALLWMVSACSPQSPLLDHEITLIEKAGSSALAAGINLEQEGKFREAAALYRQSAEEAMDAEVKARALTELADLYGQGLGVPQKPAKQVLLLKKAAALNYPVATFKLAEIYRGETGTQNPGDYAHNPAKAMTLLNSIRDAYPYAAASLIEMRKQGQLSADDATTNALEQETLSTFTTLAEQGDKDAMLALARLYRDGLLGAADTQKMEHWYRRAIEAGNITAAAELGRLWMQPDSGRPVADALALLMQVAKHEELTVARQIAELYARQGQAKEAVQWYLKAAKDPQPRRMVYNKLAEAYSLGWGVDKNETTALQWYKKAAEAGSVKATEIVVRALFNGTGTTRDEEEAVVWLEKLLALNPKRSYALAKDFSVGEGLPKSLPRAFMLAMRAAENGDMRGARYVAYAYERGEGVPANPAKASQWFAKAGITRNRGTGRGGKKAENPLVTQARQYEVKGAHKEAVDLYKKAANLGDTTAMLRLAAIHSTGLGTKQDLKETIAWYRKAAEAGDPEGQYQLGLGYARGFGVEKDAALARQWLEKAQGNGYPLATETLKTLTTTGR